MAQSGRKNTPENYTPVTAADVVDLRNEIRTIASHILSHIDTCIALGSISHEKRKEMMEYKTDIPELLKSLHEESDPGILTMRFEDMELIQKEISREMTADFLKKQIECLIANTKNTLQIYDSWESVTLQDKERIQKDTNTLTDLLKEAMCEPTLANLQEKIQLFKNNWMAFNDSITKKAALYSQAKKYISKLTIDGQSLEQQKVFRKSQMVKCIEISKETQEGSFAKFEKFVEDLKQHRPKNNTKNILLVKRRPTKVIKKPPTKGRKPTFFQPPPPTKTPIAIVPPIRILRRGTR